VRRLLTGAAKVGLSALILGYLLIRARSDGAFEELWDCSKNWSQLGGGLAACMAAVVLIHIRWYFLVRAMDIPFSLKAAFRVGFVGYLFNLAPMGAVGGDLIRSVMLIRHSPGQRAKAVASVLVDRVIGLYLLFVVASTVILCTRFWRHDEQIYLVSMITLALTAIGGLGLIVLFLPGPAVHRLTGPFYRVPRLGPPLRRLIEAVRMYRHCLGTLFVAGSITIAVHVVTVVSVHLLACGLYDKTPSFRTELVVVPLSVTSSAIPLPFGPFEAVLEFLYQQMGMVAHEGLIVALAFRLATLATAAIGMGYYFGSKAEMSQLLEAEQRWPT
jgi:uncharacterized membrane protein YbhN (UPF0104 family)